MSPAIECIYCGARLETKPDDNNPVEVANLINLAAVHAVECSRKITAETGKPLVFEHIANLFAWEPVTGGEQYREYLTGKDREKYNKQER